MHSIDEFIVYIQCQIKGLKIFLLECVKKAFKDFYQNNCTNCGNCTLPWMMSLLRTASNDAVVEDPCEDADIAKSITFQLHNFFHNALRYDLLQCGGMYSFKSVFQVFKCNRFYLVSFI